MKGRARVIFRGRVQGVYFRAHCAEKAESLGLDGYVRNLPDGSVEAVFEGDRSVIEACIEWNRGSQPYAQVTGVEISWTSPRGDLNGFHVRHA
ncbi:MAG TPA: acylphosphatase [Thermoplasmata archaeon]|nr:acylphosphatase [Thermoplasmata archaeon]